MTTATRLCRLTGILLIAGVAVGDAAPNIPPNEMPGRERERFTPSPVDRFTDPLASQNAQPLWQWQCEPGKPRRSPKPRSKQQSRC